MQVSWLSWCIGSIAFIVLLQALLAHSVTFVDELSVPSDTFANHKMSSPRFPAFTNEKSLLSKFLTPEIFDQLKDATTKMGFTLHDAIRSGVEQQDSSVGVYAGDVESYSVFWPLFAPIIAQFHKVPLISDFHNVPEADRWYKHTDWSYMAHLTSDDPSLVIDAGGDEDKYIMSTRVRVSRNLGNYPLPPHLTDEQRLQVEADLRAALLSMSDTHTELKGTYESISDMSAERVDDLEKAHRIFQQTPDRFLHSAGLDGDWPNGRGVFYTEDWTKMVWLNEEDHMRVIALDVIGGKNCYIRTMKNLGMLHEALKKKVEFAFDDMLGYISSCPTNLGTGLRASCHVKLPLLEEKEPEKFKEIVEKYHLQKRGVYGEHTESEGGVYDISNQERLGASVVDYVRLVVNGLTELIKLEKELEAKEKSS